MELELRQRTEQMLHDITEGKDQDYAGIGPGLGLGKKKSSRREEGGGGFFSGLRSGFLK
jgi:hypothetical protein